MAVRQLEGDGGNSGRDVLDLGLGQGKLEGENLLYIQ